METQCDKSSNQGRMASFIITSTHGAALDPIHDLAPKDPKFDVALGPKRILLRPRSSASVSRSIASLATGDPETVRSILRMLSQTSIGLEREIDDILRAVDRKRHKNAQKSLSHTEKPHVTLEHTQEDAGGDVGA